MQIQLKQAEIVEAIKGYIAKQGINLVGKTVDVDFTAGRKETGLTADLNIEDMAIPAIAADNDSAVETKSASVVALVKPVAAVDPAEPAAAGDAATADAASTAEKTQQSLFNS